MGDGWRERALCRGKPTSIWYPVELADQEAARAWCDPCPVRHDCLTEAIERNERDGMWGGIDEEARRRMIRIRRRTGRAAA